MSDEQDLIGDVTGSSAVLPRLSAELGPTLQLGGDFFLCRPELPASVWQAALAAGRPATERRDPQPVAPDAEPRAPLPPPVPAGRAPGLGERPQRASSRSTYRASPCTSTSCSCSWRNAAW